ncbi:UNVERIFIED_CONTAM: adenine-specific DNA-methyltransferase [Acidovorax defluvii]
MSEKPLSTPLLHTPSPAAHKLELLRQLFPQAVQTDPDGSVRVDAAQIQRALDPANAQGIRVEETGYELRWVGKQEAYHTAFARTDKIVAPVPADSKAWDSTGNLLIKGDNLDALKLLRQSYFGQVKLIYIDPPYNTKSDEFIYRDDFTARQTDILAQLGYSADNVEYIQNIYGARTHSGWLSFMYPRLLLAKDLLRDDGVIFISIDDNEQAQLKLLCDEVFGQDNFVANVIWHKRYAASNDSKDIPSMHDYVLVYQKSETFLRNLLPRTEKQDALYRYDDNDGKGKWRPDNLSVKTVSSAYLYPVINPNTGETYSPPKGRCWLTSSAKMQEWITEGRVYFGQDGQGAPQLKRYLNEVQQGIVPTTYWGYDEVGHTDSARKDLKSVFDGVAPFDNPKPVGVIQKSLLVGATKDAIVLDFFAGSGTTGEAVMRLNAEDGGQRQFILVQIPQPIDPKKQKEAHSFVTQTLGKPEATIFEITAERLRRAGDKINAAQRSQGKPEVDAGFRVYTLADDPHALVHRTRLDQATQADVAALQTAIATPQPEQRPVVLANLLLTEGLPLSATLTPLAAGSVADALWQAQDTLLVLDAVPLDALVDLLRQRKAAGTPVHHVSVYAPWVHDDNFLQGVQTLLEAEGFSADRLRLRG